MICKPEIFYKLDGFLYRNSDFNEDDLIIINEEFRESDINKSREKTFQFYYSLLDVLLQGIGLKFINEKQAEKDLSSFYKSGVVEQHSKLSYVMLNNDIDKIITISFCSIKTIPYVTKTGLKIYDDEKIIHAFGYQSKLLESNVKQNLILENLFYQTKK